MANTFDVSGVYVEHCSCADNCLCCSPGEPTREQCQLGAAWRIEDGRFGTVDLKGLQLAAVYQQACNQETLSGTLYADERATPDQRAALEELFLGGRCQRPAALQAVAQNLQTIRYQAVEVREQAGKMHVRVPGVVSATLELIPVGQPEPAWAAPGAGARSARVEMEAGEQEPSPRRYGFYSRFRWIG